MKITRILAGLISLSLLTGCAGNAPAEEVSEQTETVSEETQEESTVEDNQAPASEDSTSADTGSAYMEVKYFFDAVTLEPESISVGIDLIRDGKQEYFNSGYMYVKDSFKYKDDLLYGTPLLSRDDEGKVELEQQDIDEFRSTLDKFYKDNLADIEGDVKDKYVEIANDPSLWADDHLDIDNSANMKTDFTLTMNGEEIPIHFSTNEIKFEQTKLADENTPDNLSVGIFDSPRSHSKAYLWGFDYTYRGTMENASAFESYLRDKYETAKANSPAPEEDGEDVADSEDQTEESDSGILGKWYPDYSDFAEYYIQFNEDGTGCICIDGDETALTYTFSDGVIRVKVSTGGSNEFYVEGSNLREDFSGSLYSRKTTADQQAEKDAKEPAAITDVTGTWYDPTRYSVASFTFDADGTGYLDWGTNAPPESFTYTVRDGVVTMSMQYLTDTLKIRGDQLDDGESRYIRR